MNPLSLQSPEQVGQALAARHRRLRLEKGWKQSTLAERAGVSLASLRRFEASGRISLESLLRLAFALGRLEDFDGVFQAPPASSIAELEARLERRERKRGRL